MTEAGGKGAPDISVAITAHREGVISAATARSALQAIDHVVQCERVRVEVILVLDRADATTSAVLSNALANVAKIYETQEGDPGQARNRATEFASGEYIAFLDADDLWSFNWLTEALRLVRGRPDAVAHSACNVIFGGEKNIWWHIDSEGPFFDNAYLEWANYWDAMAFAKTSVYRRFPFRRNDLQIGFGHEDWHWNCLTLAAGIAHKPAPNTVHFKRRRKGSQSALVNEKGGTVWPLGV